MSIKLVEDTVSKKDISALCKWLKTNPRLTKGDLTLEFEKRFAELIGTKYSIFVNSGSSANLMMMYLLKVAGHTNIVIPAICWATDLAPAIQFDMKVHICDCNLENLSVDYEALETIFIEKRPTALLLVSVLGMAPNRAAIQYLCDKYKVAVIEDNCESLLTMIEKSDTYLGGFTSTLMSSFSTFYGHHMSTIEGGFITTNDKFIYNSLLMMRAHGWNRDLSDDDRKVLRSGYNISEWQDKYTFYVEGFNFRNTEISAFIGLRQLETIKENIDIRLENAKYFYSKIRTSWKPEDSNLPTFSMPLILDSPEQRDKLITLLNENEVENRPLIAGNIARQPVYESFLKENEKYINADIVHDRGMYIPNHHKLLKKDLNLMIRLVNKCLK
jgi:CDP-6-deoxy-D-xylo-4-hexulose-3-dehydrase